MIAVFLVHNQKTTEKKTRPPVTSGSKSSPSYARPGEDQRLVGGLEACIILLTSRRWAPTVKKGAMGPL